MSDTITLPREVAEKALKSLTSWRKAVILQKDHEAAITALRTALAAEPVKPITVPKTVPLPPITCGFVDVRFDGDGWFCTKCGERMPANYEAMVKHYSGYREHLELMQRKAEAVRTMSERNMK